MRHVHQAFLLIVTAFSFVACQCPIKEIVQTGDCNFRIHCYGTLQNITLPSNCRGSINGQKATELTLTQTTDRFDKNIDPEFLNSITSLTASGNWPKTNLTFLNQMTQLKKLVLTRNSIDVIEKSTPFFLLENLEYLDLSYNRLTEISELFIFESIPNNLTYLSLAHNAIKELSRNAFEDLTSLKELDLSYNYISDLSEEQFNNLTMLQTLNLENNTITNLNGALNNLDNLVHLFLRGNKLRNIDDKSVSRIQQLKTFDISGNYLNRLESTILLRHWQSIDGVCNIKLSENRITSLHNGTKEIFLRYTRELTEKNVNVMTELDLSRNSICNVGYNAFLYVLRIVKLDMSHNQLRDFIVNSENIAQVRILNLSNNRITFFFPFTFYSMRSLEVLDISNNNLRYDSHFPFIHTYNLVYVNMANNKLERGLNQTIMMKSQSENNILDLSDTGLSEVNLPGRESSYITTLILNSNKLSEIYFTNLRLKTLELKRNQIEKLNAMSLRLPLSLTSLDLSENKIREIGPSTFIYARRLKHLSLANNQLTTIQYGTFQGLTTLSSLDLSNNMITNLDSKLFMDLKTLDVLYLRSNGLVDLQYKGWLKHAFPLEIYLEGNNLSCSWLGKALADYNNGYSKMKPTVDRILPGPSIEGIPCIPPSTELELLTEAVSTTHVMADERLLVINQKILETLKEQTYYLRTIQQRYLDLIENTDRPIRELRNVRKSH
ncbi:leucine-rich repeat-containing G-protein coupled receptor 6-like [Hyposmocoma kahamanoa]|uniref:leucine-rich repeat-containing G-protein coupled receptor 6-like n=1 Tax=Hyposmocoma kahamanoa TaxID=1477025 RepID=UPI000E6D796A|nr:leucine-rich repeat-containing G-protein coupled receptor 6-like [Hyposmocoma kahamanoa]